MDFVGYGIICLIFSLVSNAFGNAITKGVATGVASKGIVELSHAILKRVLPRSFFYMSNHNKEKANMIREGLDRFANLSEDDIKELCEFMKNRSVELPKEIQKCLKDNKIDIQSIDYLNTEKNKDFIDAVSTCLIEMYDKAKKDQKISVSHKLPDDIIREIFKLGENDTIPTVLHDIACLVYKQVCSQLYIELSADSRSLSKVMQYMLYDQSEKLESKMLGAVQELRQEIFSLVKPYLTVIEMQNQNPDFKTVTGRSADDCIKAFDMLTKKDPYSFIPLKCRHCGASEWLVRNGDILDCRACHKKTAMVSNVDGLSEVVKTATGVILEKLESRFDHVDENLKEELTLLAERSVGKEYLELSLKRSRVA